MSGRLADVEARIETVHKLAAVIAAMRGIAASRAQEARHAVDGIRTFAATIGEAIGQALSFAPEADGHAGSRPPPGRHAIVALCAEQGFAGAFSDRVLDAARPLLAADPKTYDLLIVGDRGLLVADERGLAVAWSAAMVSHPGQAGALAARITEAIYQRIAQAHVTRVSVVHASPGGAEPTQLGARALVPFDYGRFRGRKTGVAPLISLPPERLLARLAEEYVFAELSEAVMLSFAAENEARMRAMIAAHDNVAKSLDGLVASARRLRQDEITDEIVELATGSLPLR